MYIDLSENESIYAHYFPTSMKSFGELAGRISNEITTQHGDSQKVELKWSLLHRKNIQKLLYAENQTL